MEEEGWIGVKIDANLKNKGYYIIQNKMHMSIKDWMELKFKELIKHENKSKV